MGSTVTITAPKQAGFVANPRAAGSMLDEAARRFGARPAVDFLGRGWSWSEIATLADRAAAGLQQRGVVKGTRVGLCLPNTHYFIVMFYAILKAGGTVVNFNPLYTERELVTQAQSAGTRIMVSLDVPMIQDKISALVAQELLDQVVVCSMAQSLPMLKSWAFRLLKSSERAAIPTTKTYVRFENLIAGQSKPTSVPINPLADVAVLQFTGGTTGVPKAAMLTHGNITTNVQQVLAGSPPLVEAGERIMGVLPFFHVFAMTAVMNLGVAIGAELVLMPRLDIKMLMAAIERKRPTIVPGVPTLFTAISNAAGSGLDLSFIKFCISGGAAISAEAADRFERLSQCSILEGYGLTEASPVVTATPPERIKRNSVGVALPGTVIEIRDAEQPERILPQGEKGEICVRGPQIMKGYLDRPDETAKSMIDGALRSGDIGYLDADGYLFIVDRIKDLILCSGYNVYPRVIEEAAYQHPAVQDAIAIGIVDAYRGHAPKLFVTLRPGAHATEAEILEFLKQHLNKIEIPKAIEIRDSLPKTLVGKLSKKELIAEEAAKPQVIKEFFNDQSTGAKSS